MFWILDLGFWCFDFWLWGLDFWCIFESSHPFPLQMFDIELDFCEKRGHVAFVSSWSMKCPHVCTGLFYGAAWMGDILRTPTSWFFRISLGNKPSPFRFFRGHELMGLRPFDLVCISMNGKGGVCFVKSTPFILLDACFCCSYTFLFW